ncbi:hypothetical protein ACFVH6_12095 [Spirillospora sp. NPDC127200]
MVNHNERNRDKSARKAAHAVRHFAAIAARYGSTVAEIDPIVHDARLVARNNDLRCLSLRAVLLGEPQAVWFAAVTEHRYELCEPFDLPTHLLRRCEYLVAVHRSGRTSRYEPMLRTVQPEPDSEPVVRDRTGIVISLPRRRKRGMIASGDLVFQLLPRERHGLRRGSRVEFCASRSTDDGRPVAFLCRRTEESS